MYSDDTDVYSSHNVTTVLSGSYYLVYQSGRCSFVGLPTPSARKAPYPNGRGGYGNSQHYSVRSDMPDILSFSLVPKLENS